MKEIETFLVPVVSQRLLLAEQLGDKMACRRALSNLGNAHVHQGKYGAASQYYL